MHQSYFLQFLSSDIPNLLQLVHNLINPNIPKVKRPTITILYLKVLSQTGSGVQVVIFAVRLLTVKGVYL